MIHNSGAFEADGVMMVIYGIFLFGYILVAIGCGGQMTMGVYLLRRKVTHVEAWQLEQRAGRASGRGDRVGESRPEGW